MIAVAFARTWHAMWWEWHVLTAVFAGIYLDRTLRRIDRHEAERLSAVVDAIRSGGPVDQILARFRQEGMSREEADVLERSARELSRVDALFHLYVAPQLATSLERQPERARLGGEEREVSVLFADLAGFTGFSKDRSASEVVEMLNRYWAAAVPAVLEEGGLIDRFAGDAIIVVFNAVTEQLDHAMRAARAAWPSARRPIVWPPIIPAGHGSGSRSTPARRWSERRRRPAAQLHRDRGHHQPGRAAAGHRPPRRGRHRAHDVG
jgi:GGDEF domain-containing protein